MKTITGALGVLTVSASAVAAGGIDRSGQSIGTLFEKGNYFELSFGVIRPDVTGKDLTPYRTETGSVAGNHNLPGLALKYDFSDRISGLLQYDQAYGADISYPEFNGFTGTGSYMLGGTYANVDSMGLTGLLRYKFDRGFSVHGGLRLSKASGQVGLRGAAYGPAFDPSNPATYRSVNGYSADLDDDWAAGYVLGMAYERPDIALRVALTYFSKISHKFDTVETLPGGAAAVLGATTVTSVTEVDTPQAINLEFQTGIAPDTLMFASARWVDWSEFKIDTSWLKASTGEGLVDLEDTVTYTLGIGRKFTENWSGSIFATYEPSGDKLISPLAPINGYKGIGVAAVYTQDNMRVTLGLRYLKLGDADPETGTPDVARAEMRDNHAVALGLKVGFTF